MKAFIIAFTQGLSSKGNGTAPFMVWIESWQYRFDSRICFDSFEKCVTTVIKEFFKKIVCI
jgi:hypothetical protein